MKQQEETDPPSGPQALWFRVGRDDHGNWVVQDPRGIRGGLFVDRGQRFASCAPRTAIAREILSWSGASSNST